MFDMLVEQRHPMTPISALPDDGHHPTDLSSPSGSSSASRSNSSPISNESINKSGESGGGGNASSVEEFSALQRLQFALEKNELFTGLFSDDQQQQNNRIHHQNVSNYSSSMIVENDKDNDSNKSNEEKISLVESPEGSPNSNPTNIFQCPICSIVSISRHSFNEHLVTHTQQIACPKCSFLTDMEDELRTHLKDAHDINDVDFPTDEDARTPKINSQGKVKTFKCKQCKYITVTKMDFWAHSKSHIRQEKMLTCPKCPFVTEYKHHLEYHLRNHFGSKPFQCTKCSYTCVNKSMLNSHLKSHSNVYQYRCADCSYATKYCHSLKLHLRKYSHNPSMVLNPDGTPNPLPIIDVYGTRRGPKMKPNKQGTEQCNNNTSLIEFDSPLNMKSENGALNYSINHNNSNSSSESPKQNQSRKRNTGIKKERKHPPVVPVSSLSPYQINREHQMISPPMPKKELIMDSSDSEMSDIIADQKLPETPLLNKQSKGIEENPSVLEFASKNPFELYTAAAINQYLLVNQAYPFMASPFADFAHMANEQQLLSHILNSQKNHISHSPHLLLQQEKRHHIQESEDEDLDYQNPVTSSSTTPLDLRSTKPPPSEKKRNRKGKAIRYDRKNEDDIQAWNNNIALDFTNNNLSRSDKNAAYPDNYPEQNTNKIEAGNNGTKCPVNLMCKYCEISFPDQVLYTMHMNYHSGDKNPFLCKSCGKKTHDKITFFLHLTTDSH